MIIYTSSNIGTRDKNEDNHSVVLNSRGDNNNMYPINLFAVYDGHGGDEISAFLKKELPKYFMSTKTKQTFPLSKTFVNKVFDHITNKIITEYFSDAKETGSTCLVVIHFNDGKHSYLQVFNVGDSRAVLSCNGMAVALTKDHKPNWPDEKKRLLQLNNTTKHKNKIYFDGYDWRICDLSVSRAIGDLESKPYISHTPDIFTYQLSHNNQFLVIACDGLWDVLSNQDVVNFILEHMKDKQIYNSNEYKIKTHNYVAHKAFISNILSDVNKPKEETINIAEKIGKYAISKGSLDNVTVIIIFF